MHISDRQLAWLSIVVGTFLGLIPILRDGSAQLRVASMMGLLILFAAVLLLLMQGTGPQYKTVSMKKSLVFDHADGSKAHLIREQRIRVRSGHLREIWCRNIVADGSIQNLRIDGRLPDEEERTGCLLSVCKRFDEPLFRGSEVTVLWAYDLLDSFPDGHEALEHDVTPALKHLELEVRLPDSRPGRSASLHVLFAGEPAKELEPPKVEAGGRVLRATRKNPAQGSTIRLSWDW